MLHREKKEQENVDVDSSSAIRATAKTSFQSYGSRFIESGSEYGSGFSILSESGSGSSPAAEI
jgi:hypothetical protein